MGGFVYVAFVIDIYACRIVGWRASRTAHAGFVLDALEQAVHDRRPAKDAGLVHHSDRGSHGNPAGGGASGNGAPGTETAGPGTGDGGQA